MITSIRYGYRNSIANIQAPLSGFILPDPAAISLLGLGGLVTLASPPPTYRAIYYSIPYRVAYIIARAHRRRIAL